MKLRSISDVLLEVKITYSHDLKSRDLDWSYADNIVQSQSMHYFIQNTMELLKDKVKYLAALDRTAPGTLFWDKLDKPELINHAVVAAIIGNTVFTKKIAVFVSQQPKDKPITHGEVGNGENEYKIIHLYRACFSKGNPLATLTHEVTHAFDPHLNADILQVLYLKREAAKPQPKRNWRQKLKDLIIGKDDTQSRAMRVSAAQKAYDATRKMGQAYTKQVGKGYEQYFRTPEERLANINSIASTSATTNPEPAKGVGGIDQYFKKNRISTDLSRRDKQKALKRLLYYRAKEKERKEREEEGTTLQ